MLLVVDTALDFAQAALVRGSVVLGASAAPAQGDAEAVAGHAEAALGAAGADWADLSGVAVTVGPGSFTGVRVAIAFAKGVGFARGLPVVGVTTLAAISASAGRDAVAVIDARHGQVFCADVRTCSAQGMARVLASEAAQRSRAAGLPLAGSAAALAACAADGIVVERLDPAAIAACAEIAPYGSLSAVYLAPVDALPQRHKALARATL